jgi:AcrR family transcriptional regulator
MSSEHGRRDPGRERAEARRRGRLTREQRIEQRDVQRVGRRGAAAVGPVWARPEPGARRASLTRDEIARAALAIADAETLEALSMRRVASELGVGTMTLYYYVRNKEELLDLMHDEIMGEVLVPADELPADWRGALTAIAHRTRVTMLRHPWVLGAPPAASGPNGMRHFEQSLAAVASLALDLDHRFDIICAVDDYTFGYLLREVEQEREDASPYGTEEWLEAITAYFDAQWSSGEFPHVRRLIEGSTARAVIDRLNAMSHDPARFDRGLDWLLDGVQRSLMPGSRPD